MVWKVKRIIITSVVICAILGASLPTFAATHSIYDGTISSTYITYFKDTISGIGFNDDYVAFRSGQNEYILIVGELNYTNGLISSVGQVKQYRYYSEGTNYSSQSRYDVKELNSFSLQLDNYIIYSNLGDYPQLVERGEQYEMLSVLLLSVFGISYVIKRIFFKR